MKLTRKLLCLLLVLMLTISFTLTVYAEGNVVYTHGVEGKDWPRSNGYAKTVTISGATVKEYTWNGNTCDVVLAQDTPQDAAITFTVGAGGSTRQVSGKINGVSGLTGTVNLVDGTASVPVFVQYMTASWGSTKTFNLTIAEKNELPRLTNSENNSISAEIIGGEGYVFNLAELFTDDDENDVLTYSVSVNGAEAVAAEVDENGNYTCNQNIAGEYELVFRASDNKKDTSIDTYTVNLKVNNSAETYEATLKMPIGIEPKVYAFAGLDSNSMPMNGAELEVTAGENNTYTVAVPVNVSVMNVVYGSCAQAVAVSEGAEINMRTVMISGVDMFGNPVAAVVSVVDSEGRVAKGSGSTFLLETGENYTFTSTPSDSKNYKTAVSTSVLEDGTGQLQMNALVDFNNVVKVTTPTGANAQLFVYNKYYDNTEFVNRGAVDNSNGSSTHYFSGCSLPAGGGSYIYRVEYPGHITKAGWVTGDVTVTYSGNEIAPTDRVDYSTSSENNTRIAEDSVLLNVNLQNNLSMSVGSSKTLKAYRAWEIIPVSYNNWIIEPNFHYNVIWESEDGVVSLKDKANNMTGGDSWKTLTANKAGTAIIEVTYDAIDIRGNSANTSGYNGVYGASDPARTGLVVVQVGGHDSSVNFGIDGMASQGNVVYEKSSPKAWDAEFDTLYFTGESGQLNLKPTASSAIRSVEVSYNKGYSWTSLSADASGLYTANILSGNNIIKVTTDSGCSYQIVRGDKVNVTVAEVEGNEKNDGDGIFDSGEVVRVTIDGLHSPIPKMAGNYNPGYMANSDGYSAHHLSYLQDGVRVQGAGSQYNWFTATNYIDITLPESGNQLVLKDGTIGLGVIGLTTFNDGGDSHRNIPDSGCTTRGSASTFHTRSMLPEITIDIVESGFTVTAEESDKYTIIPTEESTSIVKAGGSYSFSIELAEGYTKGESFAVKANDVVLIEDENGIYTVEDIQNDIILTAEGIEGKPTVSLTSGEGYSLTPCDGSESPVEEGGSYSFSIELAEGYTKGENFAVKANDVVLTADENGVYTIENITEDQIVTVEGIILDLPPEPADVVLFESTSAQWPSGNVPVFVNSLTLKNSIVKEYHWDGDDCYITLHKSTAADAPFSMYGTVAVAGNPQMISMFSMNMNGSTYTGNSFTYSGSLAEGKADVVATAKAGNYSGTKTFHLTVDGMKAEEYEVILPSSEQYGITATENSVSPVQEGGSYSFIVDLAEGYTKGEIFAVKANNVVLTADENGVYTIENIKEAQNITVEGVEQMTFEVTLPISETFTVLANEGFVSPVNYGGSYSFIVDLAEGYTKGEIFAVKANNVVLTADENGVYTIENIKEAQTITVEGVVLDYVLGDVNNDGKINSQDASLTLRYAAGLVEELKTVAADVNADGKVNSQDASLILRYAAGLITQFPTK